MKRGEEKEDRNIKDKAERTVRKEGPEERRQKRRGPEAVGPDGLGTRSAGTRDKARRRGGDGGALALGRCRALSLTSTSWPQRPDPGRPIQRALHRVTPRKECELATFPHLVPEIALVASASKAALCAARGMLGASASLSLPLAAALLPSPASSSPLGSLFLPAFLLPRPPSLPCSPSPLTLPLPPRPLFLHLSPRTCPSSGRSRPQACPRSAPSGGPRSRRAQLTADARPQPISGRMRAAGINHSADRRSQPALRRNLLPAINLHTLFCNDLISRTKEEGI